ncbi:hypothetical protein M9H77_12212 [Catharanthus roseus]|uniref:Uncharacterized protein n=1 Tax=Catharanthus roseus TaxID=4058 RepID=A0ACC0BGY4_CATRO|nr:hypothetical protein M9H77_12212 [Catharanthus roseus]
MMKIELPVVVAGGTRHPIEIVGLRMVCDNTSRILFTHFEDLVWLSTFDRVIQVSKVYFSRLRALSFADRYIELWRRIVVRCIKELCLELWGLVMKKPVNASNNECLECLSWDPSKHIRTLVHESGELESVDIRGKSSIVDEDEKNEDEEEMVRASKKRVHPVTSTLPAMASIPSWISSSPAAASLVEMSTPPTVASPVETSAPPAAASIPPMTSSSPTTASTPPGTSTPSTAASTPSATLTPFRSCHTRV